MDIYKYAVGPENYDILSRAQISKKISSNSSYTREQCDALAVTLLGCSVSATPMQGGNSYTVDGKEAGKVVQFRPQQLDMKKLGFAQEIYGRFVPQGVYHGQLESLHVYIWNRVSGPAFCRVRREIFSLDKDEEQRLNQTVQHFARFFASGWVKRPRDLEPPPSGLQEECAAALDQLSLTLPDSLHSTIEMVKGNLHLLFRSGFPMTLHHGDILENNIHVDEKTAHITGVVDWDAAYVAPFGLSLGGVEIFLNIQTRTDWHFHPSHVSLRQHFWDTFNDEVGPVSELDRRSMETSRLLGLLQTHGFEKDGCSEAYLEKLILLK